MAQRLWWQHTAPDRWILVGSARGEARTGWIIGQIERVCPGRFAWKARRMLLGRYEVAGETRSLVDAQHLAGGYAQAAVGLGKPVWRQLRLI